MTLKKSLLIALLGLIVGFVLLRLTLCNASEPDYGVWGNTVGDAFMDFKVPTTRGPRGDASVSLIGRPVYTSAADLPYGVFLEGKILDENGEPVLGVEVVGSCQLGGGSMFTSSFSQRYMADGTYRMALPRAVFPQIYFDQKGRRSVTLNVDMDELMLFLESSGQMALPVEWTGAEVRLLNDNKVLWLKKDVVLRKTASFNSGHDALPFEKGSLAMGADWVEGTAGQGGYEIGWTLPLSTDPKRALDSIALIRRGRDLLATSLEDSGAPVWDSPKPLVFFALKHELGLPPRGLKVSGTGGSYDSGLKYYNIGPNTRTLIIYNQNVPNEGFVPLFVQNQLTRDPITADGRAIELPETGYQPEFEVSPDILEVNMDSVANLQDGYSPSRRKLTQYVAFHLHGVYGLALLDLARGSHQRQQFASPPNISRDEFRVSINFYVARDLGRVIQP